MHRPLRLALGAALLPLLVTCSKPLPGKFNVVLISIDSLRADHTGPYGHKAEFAPELAVTPNLDRLARSGAVFEDAWSSSSWTLPSHMALMTGLTDRAHAVEHDEFALDPLRRTLAEQFLAAGYVTGACFSGRLLDSKYGFSRGFQDYRSGMITPQEFAALAVRKQIPLNKVEAFREDLEHTDVTSPRVNAFAREFLRAQKDRRFFLFLHYFDAHYDYRPDIFDAETAKRFDPAYAGSMDGEDWYEDTKGRVMSWQKNADDPPAKRLIDDRDLRHVMALYDAEIHWVDKHVGEVLDLIASLGLEDETIVVLTSDHGDEFFEHGSIGHRSSLYPELCRIPLVIRVPGAGSKGQRVAGLARLYDVAPSLLDWCGLPALPEAQGSSLQPLLDGKPDDRTVLHRIYARFNRDRSDRYNAREAFRNGQFTVVRQLKPLLDQESPAGLPFAACDDPRSGRDFLVFDRVADAAEQKPLEKSDPRWRQAVDAFCEAWKECEAKVAAMPHSPMSKRWSPQKSASDMAAFAALGYFDARGKSEDRQPELLPFPSPCISQR